jgi:SsrA-binding protein
MSKHKAKSSGGGELLVATNKRARFDYEVLESYEAGLALRGTEVKVLRQGKLTLNESYARIYDGEVFLVGANIPEYSHGNQQNHDPKRRRKCLLRRREIQKLQRALQQQGLTVVPLRVYFGSRGYAKVTLAVCRGRKSSDKRQHLKTKEARREIRGDD